MFWRLQEKLSLYIFYLLPWKTNFLFTFYYLPSRRTGVLFSFSVNPIALETQFFLFFSMGLISNSHRVERSTSFLIMKKRKSCRRPRPRGDCSCPACESIARQRKRNCRAIVRRLALDSFRLKSTGDQGKNWTSQHRSRSFTNIIRDIALAGWLFKILENK